MKLLTVKKFQDAADAALTKYLEEGSLQAKAEWENLTRQLVDGTALRKVQEANDLIYRSNQNNNKPQTSSLWASF